MLRKTTLALATSVALATLIVEGAGDQAAVQALLKRLTSAHTARMAAVGLVTVSDRRSMGRTMTRREYSHRP